MIKTFIPKAFSAVAIGLGAVFSAAPILSREEQIQILTQKIISYLKNSASDKFNKVFSSGIPDSVKKEFLEQTELDIDAIREFAIKHLDHNKLFDDIFIPRDITKKYAALL